MNEPPSAPRIVWTEASTQRPRPDLTEPDTGMFWVHAQSNELVYQTCGACGKVVFYPRRHCPSCGSDDLATRVSEGKGVVYSYTVIHRNADRAFAAETPYIVALVDLHEGFRLMTSIEAPPDTVSVGQAVEVHWKTIDGLQVPAFVPRPANGDDAIHGGGRPRT